MPSIGLSENTGSLTISIARHTNPSESVNNPRKIHCYADSIWIVSYIILYLQSLTFSKSLLGGLKNLTAERKCWCRPLRSVLRHGNWWLTFTCTLCVIIKSALLVNEINMNLVLNVHALSSVLLRTTFLLLKLKLK